MLSDKDLLKALKKYVDKNGPYETLAQLARRGVGSRTASGLVCGSYNHKPSSMLRLVLSEMLKQEMIAS